MDDPNARYYGAEPRRYLSFVYAFEVEVTDPTQLAAYNLDWNHEDVAGEPGLRAVANQNQQTATAVTRAIAQGLEAAAQRAGFRVLSEALLLRTLGDDGQYRELTLPAEPVRGDDGEFRH